MGEGDERSATVRNARVVGRCPVGRDGTGGCFSPPRLPRRGARGLEGERGGREKAGKYRPFPRIDFPSPIQTFVAARGNPLSPPSPSRSVAVHSLSHLPRAANLPNAHTEMAGDARGREKEREREREGSYYRSTPRGFHATFPRSTARGLKDPGEK